jgi:hypothetical protein
MRYAGYGFPLQRRRFGHKRSRRHKQYFLKPFIQHFFVYIRVEYQIGTSGSASSLSYVLTFSVKYQHPAIVVNFFNIDAFLF